VYADGVVVHAHGRLSAKLSDPAIECIIAAHGGLGSNFILRERAFPDVSD
jgi:hypothetical protein